MITQQHTKQTPPDHLERLKTKLSTRIPFTPTHKCTTLAGYLFKAAKGFFVSAPNATKQTSLKELTLRGIILGGIITLLFTAANVYLSSVPHSGVTVGGRPV